MDGMWLTAGQSPGCQGCPTTYEMVSASCLGPLDVRRDTRRGELHTRLEDRRPKHETLALMRVRSDLSRVSTQGVGSSPVLKARERSDRLGFVPTCSTVRVLRVALTNACRVNQPEAMTLGPGGRSWCRASRNVDARYWTTGRAATGKTTGVLNLTLVVAS